jgi:cytochrome b pre-mRNA-processing protein 3
MFDLFRKKHEAASARLYAQILAQARKPALFVDHGVPDTIEGRYDMMVLHVFLVVRRLSRDEEQGRKAAQALCDRFFLEMDRALREMGVGDLTLPKRMKSIAELYSGCAAAYASALDAGDRGELDRALSRNVYDQPGGTDPRAVGLGDYVRRAEDALASIESVRLLDEGVTFPDPSPDGRKAA